MEPKVDETASTTGTTVAGAIRKKALKLLRNSSFFPLLLEFLGRCGLIGESTNALVLYVAMVSAMLTRALNVFIKGPSASGKNWLATRVMCLVPKDRIHEITSASQHAWNYSSTDLRHTVVYLQECSQAGAAVEPLRLIISEGRLVRLVTEWANGQRVTKRYEVEGPIAVISTSTRTGFQMTKPGTSAYSLMKPPRRRSASSCSP